MKSDLDLKLISSLKFCSLISILPLSGNNGCYQFFSYFRWKVQKGVAIMKWMNITSILTIYVLVVLFVAGCTKEQPPKLESAEAYYNRGLTYGKKGQYDRAISDFNKAIELNPKYAMAFNDRGVAYFYKGQCDKAISDYNKAIEIDPEYYKAYSNRGNAYLYKGQINQAIPDYNKAIELNPGYALAYNNRGNVYLNKGQFDQAISDYSGFSPKK
jgi:tetratricopeptide (TPR) repeat protein